MPGLLVSKCSSLIWIIWNMDTLKKFFFGNGFRTMLSGLGFVIGMFSGALGVFSFFWTEKYDYVAESLYLDAGEPVLGYEKSAESAAQFLGHTNFDGGSTAAFLFHVLIEDYRASTKVRGIEDTEWEDQDFLKASNGLIDIFFSPGCSQWQDGNCTQLIVRFNLPGHSEVYPLGARPGDATRNHRVLTSGWGDNGEYVNQDGTWAPRSFIFDYSKETGGSFKFVSANLSLCFYSYSVPETIGASDGVWRYKMLPEQATPARLRSTISAAELASKALLQERRGY